MAHTSIIPTSYPPLSYNKPLSMIWKGRKQQVLVIGSGCRAYHFAYHMLNTGASVVLGLERNEKVTCSKIHDFPIETFNLGSKNIDTAHYSMVLVSNSRHKSPNVRLSRNILDAIDKARNSSIPLFAYDDYEGSDFWIDDLAREELIYHKGCDLAFQFQHDEITHSDTATNDVNSPILSTHADSIDEGYKSIDSRSISPNSINTQSSGSYAYGKIFLIGAGPGDPNLLTIKAKQLIQEADLVLADKLIPADILTLVKGTLRIATKYAGNANEAQNQLDLWGLEGVKQGLTVIRLKGGDPFIFGRGGEEVQFYQSHHIHPIVVPGLSSCLSAPLLAGIPLTTRGIADQFLVATGRRKDGLIPDLPTYCKTRTLVLLMAVHRLSEVTQDLISLGYPLNLPVSIIERGSMVDQRCIKGQLDTIVKVAEKAQVKPPALLVIGWAVNSLSDSQP